MPEAPPTDEPTSAPSQLVPRRGLSGLAAAVLWRRLWHVEDVLRQRFWSRRMGFPQRAMSAGRVSDARAEVREGTEVRPAPAARRGFIPSGPPATLAAGLISEPPGEDAAALVQAARLFGVDLRTAGAAGGEALLAGALRGGWPLVGISLEALRWLPEPWPPMLRSYLASGGTLFLHGLVPDANPVLERLAAALGLDVPRCRELALAAAGVTFAAGRCDFADVFAGLRVDGAEVSGAFESAGGAETLATVAAGRPLPVVLETPQRGGRIVLAAGTQRLHSRLADAFVPEQALSLLPPMMLLRRLYGRAAWHAPFALANFTVDDPILRPGLLGLDYQRALQQARSHDFHLTVATVPRELGLAEPEVIRLLQQHPDRISACYHGNDHDGYEFFTSPDRRVRFRSRRLSRQEWDLRQAAERGQGFAAASGCPLDRVMVFPHGLCPDPLLARMGEAGFLATCNWLDRYPLGATAPDDFDLGMRPADVAWHGFPLLWRRDLEDHTFAFDRFLGRPMVVFAHRKDLGPDLEPFVRRADEINRLGGVVWRGLEPIARHAYLHRQEPSGGRWNVLMTADEACLHNPDPEPRVYRVHRPHRPPETTLESAPAGVAGAAEDVEVTVEPGATAVVRLRYARGLPLPSTGRCLVAGP